MDEQKDMLIAFGGNLKTYRDGDVGWVEGPGVLFGSEEQRDLDGQFFDENTFYGHTNGDNAMASLNHRIPMYTQKTTSDEAAHLEAAARKRFKNPIKTEMIDTGILARHALDLKNAYERWVFEQTERGVFKWSSGVPEHMADWNSKTGHIEQWPISEFAYTPTPAEPRLAAITPLKSWKAAFMVDDNQETAAVYPNLKALQEDGRDLSDSATATEAEAEIKIKSEMENPIMSEQTQQAPAPADNSEVLAAIGQLAESVKAVSNRIEAIENKPVNEQPPAVNIVTKSVDTRQYDNIETGALALGLSIVKAAGKPVSEALYKAVAMRLEGDADMNRGPMSVKSYNEAARAFKSFARGIKANELVYSTQTDAANEWIGVAYSGELWDLVRNMTMIWNRIPEIPVPMGVESVIIPTLEASPTFYKVAESTAQGANPGATTNTVTTSKPTTGNATMTLSKLGAGVTFTGEVSESSVIPFAQYLRNDLVATHAEYMDAIAINGDTDASATTNINDIGGTPAATDWFLTTNGFRKSAIITTAANSRDGGSLTSADFIETVKLMGAGGREAMDRNRVSFILDPATHWAAMQLADVKTRDVFNGATIENGMLASIYGYEVLVSAEMHRGSTSLLANSAGKVDLDTQANNTKGAILAVRWDQWRRGEMRRITIEAERVPRADATEITALSRFGLVQRLTEGAAISYNLTV